MAVILIAGSSPDASAQEAGEPRDLPPAPVVAPRDVFFFNNNTVVPVPTTGTIGLTTSTINVSGIPVGHEVVSVTVSLHITHSFDADLNISLIGPGGATTVVLSDNRGGAGDNYGTSCAPVSTRTTFDDLAPTSILLSAPPFVG